MERAIGHSCNVYFFHLGRKVGAERVASWATQLGMGRRTGVDLPYEWRGRVPSPAGRRRRGRPWRPGDTLNLSIGQGDVQVTPLQVAVMMAAVANGGWIVRPHVLAKVVEIQGRAHTRPHDSLRTGRSKLALAALHLATVRRGLRLAVVSGTARRVDTLRQCRAAGKTGTAETADPAVNYAWFAGYAPFDDPEVCVVAALHRVAGHGGDLAAPVAGEALTAYFRTRVAPAEMLAERTTTVPSAR